jgi:hypothetical protein
VIFSPEGLSAARKRLANDHHPLVNEKKALMKSHIPPKKIGKR